jgi:hypothetical protein
MCRAYGAQIFLCCVPSPSAALAALVSGRGITLVLKIRNKLGQPAPGFLP